MIIGIGVDVCDIGRWRRATARRPGLVTKVLTEAEARLPAHSQAARFAAKEALVKALGGRVELGWHDVEVITAPSGAPAFRLCPEAAARAGERGVGAIHLSVSHDAGLATAFVVCEGTS